MKVKLSEIGGKLGDFQVFFLILVANLCFWVKNGGCYVNLRGLGEIDKIKTRKNEQKLPNISINSEKFSFFSKNE